ncbi:MAG: transposase [Nitrospirota bacterium]
MSRPLRVQYPGAVYHITCRGNERKEIFKDDIDRKIFLKILSQSATIYKIKIFSYVLMVNHFHLLIETPLGNLGEFMRHFNITYTGHHNRRHNRAGHLYQGRYKSILVDKATYLSMLSRYIHLNPIRIKRFGRETEREKIQYLRDYLWSSLPGYISNREKEKFIDYAMVLEEYGGYDDRGRLAYKKRIYADISERLEIKDKIIGQSILGGEEFIGWIREKFLKNKKDRECPALREIQRYKAKEEIIEAVEKEIGKNIEEIKVEKGSIRQIVMDLLYRIGGLTGVEIGRILGVDYSTVSQGRKRLTEKIQKDRKLRQILNRIEEKLSLSI